MKCKCKKEFTGFKDDNGTKIYTGDVVRRRYYYNQKRKTFCNGRIYHDTLLKIDFSDYDKTFYGWAMNTEHTPEWTLPQILNTQIKGTEIDDLYTKIIVTITT